MRKVGTRELKQHTGEIIESVRMGERVILTLRGEPVAVISPIDRGPWRRPRSRRLSGPSGRLWAGPRLARAPSPFGKTKRTAFGTRSRSVRKVNRDS